MTTYILDEREQRNAVTIFLARMACHQLTPCKTCLDYCRTLTDRAYPILAAAFRQAARTTDTGAGFGELLMGAVVAVPNPDEDPTEPQTTLKLETWCGNV